MLRDYFETTLDQHLNPRKTKNRAIENAEGILKRPNRKPILANILDTTLQYCLNRRDGIYNSVYYIWI